MSKQADDNRRIELKYRISYFHYLKLRNAVIPYARKDRYTLASAGKGYLVRSLYFDTYDYRAYHEKMDGNSDRVKFRLRSYSSFLDDSPVIKAELKVRKGNSVEKHSTVIPASYYTHFMQRRSWPEHANPILVEFQRYLQLQDLRPKVLIEYEREGYESRTRDDVRITFDHKVRSAHASSLFPEHVFFKVHHPHIVVMEIKFKNTLPSWLKSLAQSHGLKVIANSKFAQGIQVARQDLHHSDGVVVIR